MPIRITTNRTSKTDLHPSLRHGRIICRKQGWPPYRLSNNPSLHSRPTATLHTTPQRWFLAAGRVLVFAEQTTVVQQVQGTPRASWRATSVPVVGLAGPPSVFERDLDNTAQVVAGSLSRHCVRSAMASAPALPRSKNRLSRLGWTVDVRIRSGDGASMVVKSQIDGTFEGWTGETVVKLMNGEAWQQAAYAYLYCYAYMPTVIISSQREQTVMYVAGIPGSVPVTELVIACEGAVVSPFVGFQQGMIYEFSGEWSGSRSTRRPNGITGSDHRPWSWTA